MRTEGSHRLVPPMGERWSAIIAFGLIAMAALLAYVFFRRDRAEELSDLPRPNALRWSNGYWLRSVRRARVRQVRISGRTVPRKLASL